MCFLLMWISTIDTVQNLTFASEMVDKNSTKCQIHFDDRKMQMHGNCRILCILYMECHCGEECPGIHSPNLHEMHDGLDNY